MKFRGWRIALILLPVVFLAAVAMGQDNVTIPKSRLDELERKERELDRLRGDVNKTRDENKELKTRLEHAATNSTPAPAPVHLSPPLASLPAYKEGELVESADLANYYHSDVTAADERFRNRRV